MISSFQVSPKCPRSEIAHKLSYYLLNISQASQKEYEKNMEIVQNWMTLFQNDFTNTFPKIETELQLGSSIFAREI